MLDICLRSKGARKGSSVPEVAKSTIDQETQQNEWRTEEFLTSHLGERRPGRQSARGSQNWGGIRAHIIREWPSHEVTMNNSGHSLGENRPWKDEESVPRTSSTWKGFHRSSTNLILTASI